MADPSKAEQIAKWRSDIAAAEDSERLLLEAVTRENKPEFGERPGTQLDDCRSFLRMARAELEKLLAD